MLKRLLVLAGLLALAAPSWAQAPVQQSATMLNACQPANANGTAQQTITITPLAGQYVYVCAVDAQHCASGSAGAAGTPVFITTTNMPGTFRVGTETSIAANTCVNRFAFFGFPVKSSAAGTAVTFVSPAAETNVTYNMNVYYYIAP